MIMICPKCKSGCHRRLESDYLDATMCNRIYECPECGCIFTRYEIFYSGVQPIDFSFDYTSLRDGFNLMNEPNSYFEWHENNGGEWMP